MIGSSLDAFVRAFEKAAREHPTDEQTQRTIDRIVAAVQQAQRGRRLRSRIVRTVAAALEAYGLTVAFCGLVVIAAAERMRER